MSPLLWCEMFTGTASVTLQLLGGAATPIGYMGNKRRWSRLILDIMGMHERPDVIVLCDAGPWGEAWEVILDVERRPLLVERLRSWSGEDPSALWRRLAEAGQPEDTVERVASWLWLQGRSASNTPVWWCDGAVVMPDPGGKLKPAVERARVGERPGSRATGGVRFPPNVADRIERIARLPWPVVYVVRTHAAALALITAHAAAGGRVLTYHDPPYDRRTRYAAVCPREDVLDLARACATTGSAVVSEAVPLPLDGWHTVRLTEPHARHAEWLTMSTAPAMAWPAQLTLWAPS
jgi:hypothetical protein